jgi:hypothetical protein
MTTTRELLELARLDALGLLDEDERLGFERAFATAPSPVQEQVRREQARLTDIADMLPDVAPPADLRSRVLAAVRDAVAAMAGRNQDVLAKIEPLALSMRRNVSPLWRAACIGFATATLVLLAVTFSVQRTYDTSLQAFRDGELAEQIAKQLGPGFVDTLLSRTADRVAFTPASDRVTGGVMALIDAESGVAFLACKGLPAVEGNYRLVVLDSRGSVVKELVRFPTKGELTGRPFPAVVAAGSTLAILPPETDPQGKALFTSL